MLTLASFTHATLRISAVFAVVTCVWRLSVCHTPVLCLNGWTYLKTFLSSGSAIILVFHPLHRYQIPREPFSGDVKYTLELVIFDWNRRLFRKWYKTGSLLLCNVNRKSYAADRSMSVPMTSSDLWPGFQGFVISGSRISQKWCILGRKLL